MYTAKDIYDTFFTNADRYYDSQIAGDFFQVDKQEMAELFFENIGKEAYSIDEFLQVCSLAKDFQNLVHSNFNFWISSDPSTGEMLVRAS